MATIIINGSEYTLPEGEKLNAIQMAKRVGVDIPYYCWHPALSVVANCRMCEIEVGQQGRQDGRDQDGAQARPRLPDAGQGRDRPRHQQPQGEGAPADDHGVPPDQPPARLPRLRPGRASAGCRTTATNTARRTTGSSRSGLVNPRKDVSDLIQLNQDRCIMCTRCVRFTREITQTGELEVMRAGQSRRDRHLPRPAGRQPAGRQRRRPLPGRRPARQGLPAQAARLVPLQARLDLHPLLDRLQHHRRGEPRRALAVQAAVQPARQRLLDLRRGPLQLQGRQRPATCSPRCTSGEHGDLQPVPSTRPSTAVDRGLRRGSSSRAGQVAGCPLAVPDGRGGLPAGAATSRA